MNLKKLTDAYFSKEAYERKMEYAYKKSGEGIRAIAEYYAQQDGLTEEDDEYEDAVSDYETIFAPVSELSHLRHEIHSSGMHYNLDFWNHHYETLIDEVNELNQKYELAPKDVQYLDWESLPDTDIMSNSEICDFMGWDETYYVDEDGDLIEDKEDEFCDNVAYAISKGIDEWSNSVRKWFWYVNQKFGTDFPDRQPKSFGTDFPDRQPESSYENSYEDNYEGDSFDIKNTNREFNVGDRVVHKSFGEGVVKAIGNGMITISFDRLDKPKTLDYNTVKSFLSKK